MWFEFVFFFILGSMIGSFLNVIIVRWPKEESFVSPRSHCPNCKQNIPFYLNVPIFAWIFLLGKSHCCKQPISILYPFVEFVTGALFLFTFWKFGWSIYTLELCVFLTLSIPCFFIDLKHYLLPDILTFPGMFLGLLGSFFSDTRTPMSAFLGFAVGGGFFWLLSWLYEKTRKKEGMGFGDVKLIAWLGALGGLGSVSFIIFVSSFLGAGVGIFVIAFFKGSKETALPFGPFLIFSGFLYYYFSSDLLPFLREYFIIL